MRVPLAGIALTSVCISCIDELPTSILHQSFMFNIEEAEAIIEYHQMHNICEQSICSTNEDFTSQYSILSRDAGLTIPGLLCNSRRNYIHHDGTTVHCKTSPITNDAGTDNSPPPDLHLNHISECDVKAIPHCLSLQVEELTQT